MEFPYLCLLVSGGHSMLLVVHGVGDYTLLGTSLDDSVGAQAALCCHSHHRPTRPDSCMAFSRAGGSKAA